jgi:hypothetical protein
MDDLELDLATLDGLSKAVANAAPTSFRSQVRENLGGWRGTYCGHCGDLRRMTLIRLHWTDRWSEVGTSIPPSDNPSPALFIAVCLECESGMTLVVFPGPQGMQLVALPSTYGGLSTPNTPESVAFYLDQAQKCQAMGALSAAVAMYRAALEHVLHEQGYTEGMLGKRIETLMADEHPPEWRGRLGDEYLGVINKLANAAIHANNGDVSQQMVFDAELLRGVRELFIELLDEIYEQPTIRANRLARLREAAGSIERS